MKTASFGHFFGFHPHGQQEHKTSAALAGEHGAALVFRGQPYHKDETAAPVVVQTATGQPCRFRGQRYLRTVAVVEGMSSRTKRGTRVFRGAVVRD